MQNVYNEQGSVLHIREIVESDALTALKLILDMADESDNYPFTSEDYAMSIENQRSFINYMQSLDNCIFLGAFLEDELCGIIYLEGGRRHRTHHICNLGMGVKKKYWNNKVATKLMEKAMEFVYSNDHIAKIDLQVRTDNKYAIALYKRFGFEIEGKNKRALFINDYFYDYLNMGKVID